MPSWLLGWFWKGVDMRGTERLFSTTRRLAVCRSHCCRSESGCSPATRNHLWTASTLALRPLCELLGRTACEAAHGLVRERAPCGFMRWTFLIWRTKIYSKPSSNPLQKAKASVCKQSWNRHRFLYVCICKINIPPCSMQPSVVVKATVIQYLIYTLGIISANHS